MSDPNSIETVQLLRSVVDGDETGWQQLQDQYRSLLHRLVSVRLDKRMSARVDASDVVQDAFLEAWANLDKYIAEPKMPFYLWLRSITGHKLMSLHRFHLGAAMRAAGREVSIYNGAMPETSNIGLAEYLVKDHTRASEVAMRAEIKHELEAALDQLDPLDCEILTLRHYEQLSNADVAIILQIKPSTASKRYIRALRKVKQILSRDSDRIEQ